MSKKIVFTLAIEGSEKLVTQLADVELRLSDLGKEVNATKKEIDILNKGTDEQKQALLDEGKTLDSLKAKYAAQLAEQKQLREERNKSNKEIKDAINAYNNLEKAVPTDSLIGLRQTYKELRKEIDLMDTATRHSAEGLEKIKKAADVKKQIDEMGDSVNDFRSRVGGYYQALERFFSKNPVEGATNVLGGIIDPIAGLLSGGGPIGAVGGLLSSLGDTANKLGPAGTAVGVLVTGTAALAGYVQQLTIEYEKLNDEVGDLTGLTGQSLVSATVGIKTLSEVFDQDFNEVLRAANSLTREVTGDFDKSMALIEKGFLAGADASGEYLDSLREYSTQVREAGLSGEEFLEILIRSTQEGVYSDKGIDAIKEFGLRIREQTSATRDALVNAFGPKFTTDLFKGINDKSISTSQAIKIVSSELSKGQITAKQTQTILADVFGGPGEDAGLRFIKILGDVDGNLDGLISTTDAYTIRQMNQLNATRELNQVQQDLASQFAGMGTSLDSLGTQIQTFGLRALDNLTTYFRGIGEIYSKDGIIGVITASEKDLDAEREKLRQKDYEALRQITSKELEENEKRRQSAIAGTLTIQELTQEQAKLKQEIDEARVSGKDYTEVLDAYNQVTKNIAESTKIFATNVQKSSTQIKEVAKEGSIEALTKKVSDLNSQIAKSTPNKAKALIDDLNKAELNLSKAKKELDDFKKQYNDLNPSSPEEVLRVMTERINQQREIEIAYANETLENQRSLANSISLINIENDKKILEERLKTLKEGSADALKVQNEINAKSDAVAEVKFKIVLDNTSDIIANTEAVALSLAESVSKSEQELVQRKNAIKLNGEIFYLKESLKNERLREDEILKIENQISEKKKALKETEASLAVDRINREAQIEKELNSELAELANEADLLKLEEYEQKKSELILSKDIERLELIKEQKIREGEELSEIEKQIAEKRLEYDKEVNEKRITETKKRLENEKKLQEANAEIVGSLVNGVADTMAGVLDGSIKDAEEAQKAILKVILDTVEAAAIAQATAWALAQPDSVATFGLTGAARAGLIGALIKAAFTVAKSAILSEQGNILGFTTGDMIQGPAHAGGGVKFFTNFGGRKILNEAEGGEAIIKKESTQMFPGLISAINEFTGGKQLHPDSNRWKKFLVENRMEYGGIVARQPQLISGNTNTLMSLSRIPAEDIEMMARVISLATSSSMKEAIGLVSDQVASGLDKNNRLKERERSAQQNSLI